jgi:hypothetical protein
LSIEIHQVARARMLSESSFAADGSGTLGNYTDVPFREGSCTVELTTDSHDPQQAVQTIDQYRKEVLGKRSAKLTMTLNLAPTGTAAAAATAAVQGALGKLLKASMGGEKLGTGSTAGSGSTASVIAASTGTGSQWESGSAMGWLNSSGQLEVREVQEVDTDDVTVKYAFSGSPSSSDVLYGAATYYLTQDPTESLQFLVAGVEAQDRWLLLGGQLTAIALAVAPDGSALPSLQFTYEFATYLESDETAGSVTGAMGIASYSNYNPIVGHAGDLRAPNVGQVTMLTSHRVHASAIAFTPKFSFVRVTSPSGEMTVLRWRRARVAPVIEGSWTEPFQDLGRWQARDARTDKAVWYQMGRTAAATVMLSAPTVQFVNPQRVADGGGIAATTMAWKGRNDEDVGGATTDLAISPFRIHLA